MIPDWTNNGLLPPGIHAASLTDVESRFVYFDRSNQRLRIYANFSRFVVEAQRSGIVRRIILAGSFVTNKPEPNDFDCILVFDPAIVGTTLSPFQYNLMSRRTTRRAFDGDIMPAADGSIALERYLAFFQTTREGEAVGVVEINL